MDKEDVKQGPKNPTWKWVVLVVLVLILVLIGVFAINKIVRSIKGDSNNGTSQQNEIQWPSQDAKYIKVVPLDLTQIEGISKYRSCAGHDYSGYNFEQTKEENRSMKHYIFPISEFQGTIDKVKMFAPFDGKVSNIDAESDQIGKSGKRPKTGNSIRFSTPVDKNAYFEFSHIYFVKDFKVGDKVKSGELVGYAALGDEGNDFDIVLSGPRETMNAVFGSAFDHMTDSVLAEFAKYGITPENTKFTKEYRDANPCDFDAPSVGGRTNSDWIQLNHRILKR